MSLRKTTDKVSPHATLVLGDWKWLVLKVNQPSKNPHDAQQYATWFVAVKSPHTFGSYEMGDNYAHEILSSGAELVHQSPEFEEYINGHQKESND